jgi:hypothetical protein
VSDGPDVVQGWLRDLRANGFRLSGA